MKTICFIALSLIVFSASTDRDAPVNGFVNGNPAIQSISAMAFGPDGVLFLSGIQKALQYLLLIQRIK